MCAGPPPPELCSLIFVSAPPLPMVNAVTPPPGLPWNSPTSLTAYSERPFGCSARKLGFCVSAASVRPVSSPVSRLSRSVWMPLLVLVPAV